MAKSERPLDRLSDDPPREFPILLGVIVTIPLELQDWARFTDLLRQYVGRAEPALLLIQGPSSLLSELQGVAEKAGFSADSIAQIEMPEVTADEALTLIHSCDDVILIGPAAEAEENKAWQSYALANGCASFTRFHPDSGEVSTSCAENSAPKSEWLPDLFAQMGLTPKATLDEIFRCSDALANQTAPATRRWWQWIMALQGLAVILPLAWFLAGPFGFPSPMAALSGALGIVLLTGIIWLLRWRGMQVTWARSRLVAEVCRSLGMTARLSLPLSLAGLESVSALRPLLWHAARARSAKRDADWRKTYVDERIDGQAAHFAGKQREAVLRRDSLTKWATILLDVALALAAVGLAVTITPYAKIWVWSLGGDKLQTGFGVLAAALPLTVLILQGLKTVLELGRRTARYQQQQVMLQDARERIFATTNEKCLQSLAIRTEQNLRAEVIEWYFQAETSEHFFDRFFRRSANRNPRLQGETSEPTGLAWFGTRFVSRVTAVVLFIVRVVLGRLVLPLVAVSVVLAWLSMSRYLSDEEKMTFRNLAKVATSDQETWSPQPDRAENGCILIAHGLYGEPEEANHWTGKMAQALAQRLKAHLPEIGIVNWSRGAKNLGFSPSPLDDLAGIRDQARLVGDFVALRLNELIKSGRIRADRPIHLIGHSAGGFLVARVALNLQQFGYGENIHVTILDTPGIDREITEDLARAFGGRVDFYQTSDLAFNKLSQVKEFKFRQIKNNLGPIEAHSYATEWYLDTITNGVSQEGFNWSPMAGDR